MIVITDDTVKLARRIAGIMGASSGAAQAVQRYDILRAAGHPSDILLCHGVWLVVEP
jgi:hypothetical protein